MVLFRLLFFHWPCPYLDDIERSGGGFIDNLLKDSN